MQYKSKGAMQGFLSKQACAGSDRFFCPGAGIASFPGSPRVRTKNKKESGEPGKIHHMRNVIGRENLITCGQMNELAHALLTEYTLSVVKAFIWLTKRDHWVTLPGSTASYGERTQTCTFEDHDNLHTYLTN